MINTFLESYKREQAAKARDLAYIIEDAEEEFVDDCVEMATHEILNESVIDDTEEDMKEMREFASQIDAIEIDEEAELQRIMESEEGITFDQMIGIAPIESD